MHWKQLEHRTSEHLAFNACDEAQNAFKLSTERTLSFKNAIHTQLIN